MSSLNVVQNKPAAETHDGPLLTLTDVAVRMIQEAMKAEGLDQHALRVGVVGGGCSGFNYQLDFDEEDAAEGDVVWHVADSLEIRVDPVSAPYLKGVKIDYVTQGLQSGFKFENPNAQKTCGCGTSFSV